MYKDSKDFSFILNFNNVDHSKVIQYIVDKQGYEYLVHEKEMYELSHPEFYDALEQLIKSRGIKCP